MNPAESGTLFHRTATHLRGRVDSPRMRDGGRPQWWYSVVNTATGEVLLRSDAFTLQAAISGCSEATAAARAAWFWGLTRQNLDMGADRLLTLDRAEQQTVMALVAGVAPDNLEPLVARILVTLQI